MKLKLDAEGHAVVLDGKPVYINEDNSETAVDVAGTIAAIKARNTEIRTMRERAEAAEAKVTAFVDIDPELARTALATVAKLDQKTLLQAGQVDSAIAAALKPVQEQLAQSQTKLTDTERRFHDSTIGTAFATSKYLDKTRLTARLAKSEFGSNFSVDENGAIRATDANGQPIFSPSNPGRHADFDEAFEVLVGAHPDKNEILKGANLGGGGALVHGGGGPVSLKKASQMTAAEKGLFIRENGSTKWQEKLAAENAKPVA